MIEDRLKKTCEVVDKRLDELLKKYCEEGVLFDAMRYSLMAGGKRLRPALCLMSASLFGNEAKALDFACALEMIHSYSLIHDDLPAMDNDSLRRGKPTNHVVFGEAMAILAGDGLLNTAFEVMVNSAASDEQYIIGKTKAMGIIAKAAGSDGMIQGQAADIEFEGKDKDEQVLSYIHERKTAAMITASVLSGAVIMGASDEEISALKEYGHSIGLVFQIVDDILDVEGDQDKLGKTLGKDEASGKQTFASIYGLDKSKQIAQEMTIKAKKALSVFSDTAEELILLADFLLLREK